MTTAKSPYQKLFEQLSRRYPVYIEEGPDGSKWSVVLDLASHQYRLPMMERREGMDLRSDANALLVALALVSAAGLDLELYTGKDERLRSFYQYRIIGKDFYREGSEYSVRELPWAILRSLITEEEP